MRNIADLLVSLGPLTPNQRKHVLTKVQDLNEIEDFSFEADYLGLRFIGHTRDLISRHVYFTGSYELGILTAIQKILQPIEGAIVFDVGANSGVHSLYLSRHSKQVHAFEPHPEQVQALKKNLAVNNIQNVIVHPVGLGPQTGTFDFFGPSPENTGTGTFLSSNRDQRSTEVSKFSMDTGDSIVAEQGIDILHLIKIDTEGFEVHVLRGLMNSVKKFNPFLILEYSEAGHREFLHFPEIKDFLLQNYTAEVFFSPNEPHTHRLPWEFNFYGTVLFSPKNR